MAEKYSQQASDHLIPLWPVRLETVRAHPAGPYSSAQIELSQIYPSGRQALVRALEKHNLKRWHSVAIPRWSSACVLSSVSRVATPKPYVDQADVRSSSNAVLIYEQWGWERSESALSRLLKIVDSALVIFDRVDTCFGHAQTSLSNAYEIYSLGKTLGSLGGGLLALNGTLCPPPQIHSSSTDNIWDLASSGETTHVHVGRDYARAPSPDLRALIQTGQGVVEQALAEQCAERKDKLALIADTSLSASWSPWMFEACERGVSPALAPLLRGADTERIKAAQKWLADVWSVETALYNFNYSVDLLEDGYEPCLALPLHAQVPSEAISQFAAEFGAKRKSSAVVGGGVIGVFCARILRDKHQHVDIIERAPTLSGLLSTVQGDRGASFDLGTHVVMDTGCPSVDELINSEVSEPEWNVIEESLREGAFYQGQLATDSGCLDVTRALGSRLTQALGELAERAHEQAYAASDETLEDQVVRIYGPTLAEVVFRPVVNKFVCLDLSEVAPDTHLAMNLNRLRLVDDEVAASLKLHPAFDQRVAYWMAQSNTQTTMKAYPRHGGIQKWFDLLATEAQRFSRVRVHTDTYVKSVSINGRMIQKMVTSNGQTLDPDICIWTAPVKPYLDAADLRAPSSPPHFRSLAFIHLIYDQPFPHDLHYACCYDPGFTTFRMTFYPALAGRINTPPYQMTAEVILDPTLPMPDTDRLTQTVENELRDIGAVAPNARTLASKFDSAPMAWPIGTPESNKAHREQVAIAEASADNLVLLGRGSRGHFLNALLRGAYSELSGAVYS